MESTAESRTMARYTGNTVSFFSGGSINADQSCVYRFSNISPSKIARTPLALKNNSRTDVNAVNADKSGNKTPTGRRAFFNTRPGLAVTPISYRKLPETSTNGQQPPTENGEKMETDNVKKQLEKSIVDNLLAMNTMNGQSNCDTKIEEKPAPFSMRQASLRLKGEKCLEDKQHAFPQLQMVARQLSLEEVESVWKTLALSR